MVQEPHPKCTDKIQDFHNSVAVASVEQLEIMKRCLRTTMAKVELSDLVKLSIER
jgi:hypothetical protein